MNQIKRVGTTSSVNQLKRVGTTSSVNQLRRLRAGVWALGKALFLRNQVEQVSQEM